MGSSEGGGGGGGGGEGGAGAGGGGAGGGGVGGGGEGDSEGGGGAGGGGAGYQGIAVQACACHYMGIVVQIVHIYIVPRPQTIKRCPPGFAAGWLLTLRLATGAPRLRNHNTNPATSVTHAVRGSINWIDATCATPPKKPASEPRPRAPIAALELPSTRLQRHRTEPKPRVGSHAVRFDMYAPPFPISW